MVSCKKQFIPQDVCYVKFTDAHFDETFQEDIGYTVRDEMVIIDRNKEGAIIGVELVGPGKPCQGGHPD